jgi:frizzled protein 1/7
MKHEGTRTDKLEKFMVRIGVFSILYMLPAIILICCYFYEQSTYSKWVDAWLRKNSNQFSISDYYLQYIPQSQDGTATVTLPNQTQTTVHFTLYMIKYSMMLIVGITSGFWIWSRKTMNSWRRFFSSFFVCCCSNIKSGHKHEAAV